MAEVVNLRQARKHNQRAAKAKAAEANRALHGESKAAKTARRAEAHRFSRLLDGAKLERE